MGNLTARSESQSSELDSKLPAASPRLNIRRFANLNRANYFSEFNFSDLVSNLSARSFASFGSHRSTQSTCSVNRPWSRVSRRQWNERTLSSPLISSKTAWPVPLMESLFLPEFKIRDDISEDSFVIIGSISTGAFGKVFKVQKKDTNEIYAMKILSKAQIVANNAIQQVKDEVKIQQLCGHHPFIVNCPYYWQSRKKLYIVSDFISGGELLKLLQDVGRLPDDVVRIYVAEIALAIDFLHNAGIIYRDLKLENILLTANGHVQIIDFGLSKWLKYGSRTNTICGTLQYIAPEILQWKSYGHSVDWWSLGIVMTCMVMGQVPFPCSVDENGEVRQIPDMDCSKEAKDLIQRLLVVDPAQRLRSLAALKRVAFFKGFDFDNVKDMVVNFNA